MKLLKKKEILRLLREKTLSIEPFESSFLEKLGYNIRIGDTVMVWDRYSLDFVDFDKNMKRYVEKFKLKKNIYFPLHSNETVIVKSLESIRLPEDVLGILHTKAKRPLYGLIVHTSGGIIHPGWSGNLLLPITNIGNITIRLTKGDPIAFVTFWKLD